MLALRDYKKDTRTKIATGAVTETGLPNSNVLYYIMNFLTMHGVVCARQERSRRSSSTSALLERTLKIRRRKWMSCGMQCWGMLEHDLERERKHYLF